MIIPKYAKLNELFLTGIYFIFQAEEIIYIGKSINLINRIVTHHLRNRIEFVRFIPCDKSVLDKYESRWIRKFKPKFNIYLFDEPILKNIDEKGRGRKPKHAFNTLEIGQKTALSGKAKENPHQFIYQYNKKRGRKMRIVRDGNKIFAERIA